jgi:CHAT domain-containing protein/Flp pilus assembly protein TadD
MEQGELRRYLRKAFQAMDPETQHISVAEIAAFESGELPALRSKQVEIHLEKCVACRERLHDYQQFVLDCQAPPATDLSEEWASLKRRLRPGKRVSFMRIWLPAAAAVLLAGGVSWIAFERWQQSPQRLLAQAYREQRTAVFRMAGAGYGPLRQARDAASAFARPPSLLKAQAELAEKIKSNPDDPEVLRLQGEAEMIGGDAAAAVRTLERASDLRPEDARILGDLGAALAMRGDAEGQFQDYFSSIEALSHSLHLQPRSTEVLFNRALVLEKAMLFDQAVEQWQAYLKLDSSSDWAKEAQEHLSNLQRKMKSREDTLHEVHSDPARFLAEAASGRALDVELYLPEVMRWLPNVDSDETSRQAVDTLAQMLKQRGDDWLADLVARPMGADALAGIENLNIVDAENRKGNTVAGLAAASLANRSFLRSGNLAGSLRSRYMGVVMLKNSLHHVECLTAAEKLEHDLRRHAYVRMRAQLMIEHAICSMRLGRLNDAAVDLQQAMKIGREAGFKGLELTAGNFYIASLGHIGLTSDVFSSAQQVLRDFWNGAYPPRLWYQSADELRDIMSQGGQKYAAWFLARSAAWAAQADSSPLVEAPARANLAVAAQAVEEPAAAQTNLAISDRLYAGIPPGYRLGVGINLAKVEMNGGNLDAALNRLEKLREAVPTEPSAGAVSYHAALGEVLRRKGRLPEAISAFRESIDLGSRRLASQAGERERAGVLKTIESSFRGLVAAQLASPNGSPDALQAWQSYRALDSSVNMNHLQPPHGPVLWFVQLPEGFVAWLTRDGEASMHRLEVPKDELATVVARFLRECSDPSISTASLRGDAQQLYQWMIEPFAAQLTEQDRNLIVDLDGILTAVPVQALMSRDGRYLGDRFSIVVSTGYGAQPSPPVLASNARVLVVANPLITGESARRFPTLPASLQEAEAVRGAFPAAAVLKGMDATVDSLVAALPGADAVHFAGHGYTNSENGALLFAAGPAKNADYDLLRSTDLHRQDWSRSRLVVLSACATAEGEIRGAHNPESLVRALTKAGPSRVVASLWNVDSDATANLMRVFYTDLAKGSPPEQALWSAQQWMRQRPGWEHPYYWAGFHLYGMI